MAMHKKLPERLSVKLASAENSVEIPSDRAREYTGTPAAPCLLTVKRATAFPRQS
jgi:hypothetical protein